jgi:hypothetical protein
MLEKEIRTIDFACPNVMCRAFKDSFEVECVVTKSFLGNTVEALDEEDNDCGACGCRTDMFEGIENKFLEMAGEELLK